MTILEAILNHFKSPGFFFLENGVNTDTSDPKVVVYLKFFGNYLINVRELEKEEQGRAVWDVLGVSHEEFSKDPSLGCKNVLEALTKYGGTPQSQFKQKTEEEEA